MENKIEKFEFKAEMKRLLNLLTHSLYANKEVFLRELASNASDALNKLRFLRLTEEIQNPESELAIKISVDENTYEFSIEDSGIGMSKDELINYLGSVANSGAFDFLEKIKDEKAQFEGNMIGQFGVGFYSIFMAADEVTVDTKRANLNSNAYRWISKGEGDFSIEEIEKEERGTKISFKFKEDAQEFAKVNKIKEVLNKYSNFIDFPIYVNGEKVNTISAIWQKKKEDISDEALKEFYKFITNDFNAPISHLQVNIEGTINFKSLLFIPESSPSLFYKESKDKYPRLYANKVLIQENCDSILPEYLSFIRGVVDTEDLPLNVSRETIQHSAVINKIKNVLVGKILSHFEDFAKDNKTDFLKFYKNYSSIIKMGLNTDYSNKDKIVEILRFETNKTEQGEMISLKEYTERMQAEQNEIYYIMGDKKETIEQNPLLEYFNKKGIEVLLLSDPSDIFTFPYIMKYQEKEIKSIEKAEIKKDEQEDTKAENDKINKSLLIEVFKDVLKDKIEDVIESTRLIDTPAALVSGKYSMDMQMEKMMKIIDQNFTPSKKTLEINVDHPLMANLAKIAEKNTQDETLKNSIEHIFLTAQLVDGSLGSPIEYAKKSFEFLQKATK